jgi:iron complex outermembrane recepter protein
MPPGFHRLLAAAVGCAIALPGAAQAPAAFVPSMSDTVVVTGTRARDRTLLNTAVPIDVLTQEDLARAAGPDGNLAAALTALLPSMNFPRQSNSGGADHVRAAQLRGMSPDQVLVLVNGKRRHAAAIVNLESKIGKGTNPVDLNSIPLNAIKRVEVLRDGAGAQYGSDAIAGVINIILDDAVAGGEITAATGTYRTRFEPSGERITDGRGVELRGKTAWDFGSGAFVRIGAEAVARDSTNRAGPDQIPFFEEQTPANFALQGRRNYRAGDPDVEDLNLWLNASAPLSARHAAYGFATYNERDSTGAAFFRYPDSFANVRQVYPQGYLPETTGRNRDLSIAAGVRGALDAAWDYDASLTAGGNRFEYGVRNSLNASLGTASPTQFDLGTFRFDQTALNFDVSRTLPMKGFADAAAIALGAELRRGRFKTTAGDPASYAAGTAGGPSGAQAGPGMQPVDAADISRNVFGAYVDVSGDVSPALSLNGAARYDRYSDVGGAATGKLSARLALAPAVALRGSASTNFRAPSLAQTGFSFTVTDFGEDGQLTQVRTLPVASPIARALGASDLKAEKSTNLGIGLTVQPARNFTLTLDAYRIDVKDRITLSETFSGEELTAATGLSGVNFFTNAVDTRTRGADLVGTWLERIGAGRLALTLAATVHKTTLTRIHELPPELVALGLQGSLVGLEEQNTLTDAPPRKRLIATAQWRSGAWMLQGRATRHGETTRVFDFGDGFTPTQTYEATWQFDLEAEVQLMRGLWLSLGGVNVGDKYPARSIDDIAFFGNLPYDVLSPIGFNGAYYYARLRYTF